ncbi:hypothetical protein R6Z07F_004761 [Ovis aries]
MWQPRRGSPVVLPVHSDPAHAPHEPAGPERYPGTASCSWRHFWAALTKYQHCEYNSSLISCRPKLPPGASPEFPGSSPSSRPREPRWPPGGPSCQGRWVYFRSCIQCPHPEDAGTGPATRVTPLQHDPELSPSRQSSGGNLRCQESILPGGAEPSSCPPRVKPGTCQPLLQLSWTHDSRGYRGDKKEPSAHLGRQTPYFAP